MEPLSGSGILIFDVALGKVSGNKETVLEELIRDGGTIDRMRKITSGSEGQRRSRWGGCMGTFEGQKFDEGIAELKRFMKERLAWMDEQFVSVEILRKSFGYYANSSLIWISEADQTSERENVRIVEWRQRCRKVRCPCR